MGLKSSTVILEVNLQYISKLSACPLQCGTSSPRKDKRPLYKMQQVTTWEHRLEPNLVYTGKIQVAPNKPALYCLGLCGTEMLAHFGEHPCKEDGHFVIAFPYEESPTPALQKLDLENRDFSPVGRDKSQANTLTSHMEEGAGSPAIIWWEPEGKVWKHHLFFFFWGGRSFTFKS